MIPLLEWQIYTRIRFFLLLLRHSLSNPLQIPCILHSMYKICSKAGTHLQQKLSIFVQWARVQDFTIAAMSSRPCCTFNKHLLWRLFFLLHHESNPFHVYVKICIVCATSMSSRWRQYRCNGRKWARWQRVCGRKGYNGSGTDKPLEGRQISSSGWIKPRSAIIISSGWPLTHHHPPERAPPHHSMVQYCLSRRDPTYPSDTARRTWLGSRTA